MKPIQIILTLLFIGIFIPGKSFSQATVDNNYDITVYLTRSYYGADSVVVVDTLYTLNSGIENIRVSSVGNFLRIVTFKLDKDHPLLQRLLNSSKPISVLRLTMQADIDGDGFEETIVDEMAVLTRSGNLKFVYHSNGAGSNLPSGWNF